MQSKDVFQGILGVCVQITDGILTIQNIEITADFCEEWKFI